MDEIDPQATKQDQEPAPRPASARGMNLGAVAGGVILIGLLAFGLYRRGASVPPAAAPAPAPTPAAGEAPPGELPEKGAVISQVTPVRLSPEASVMAERYRCVCGCNDLLSVCTCNKTPGSNEMKTFLQALVDQKKASRAIDQAMVQKWGAQAMAATAPAPPIPAPPKR